MNIRRVRVLFAGVPRPGYTINWSIDALKNAVGRVRVRVKIRGQIKVRVRVRLRSRLNHHSKAIIHVVGPVVLW